MQNSNHLSGVNLNKVRRGTSRTFRKRNMECKKEKLMSLKCKLRTKILENYTDL
jgi:hypothetical protein